jgi:hypothetical protein
MFYLAPSPSTLQFITLSSLTRMSIDVRTISSQLRRLYVRDMDQNEFLNNCAIVVI